MLSELSGRQICSIGEHGLDRKQTHCSGCVSLCVCEGGGEIESERENILQSEGTMKDF